MFRIFLLLIFVINSEFSSGQFNDSIHNVLGAAATGNINTTNDGTNYLFNHGIKYGLSRSDISLNSNSSWIYGESQSKKINNDYSSSLDFNLYKTFKLFFTGDWQTILKAIHWLLMIRNKVVLELLIIFSTKKASGSISAPVSSMNTAI